MLRIVLLTLGLFFFSVLPSAAVDANLFTLWPLIDNRADAENDYRSLHLLGPLFKYQEHGEETTTALRPLVYTRENAPGSSRTNILYPLCSLENDPEGSTWNCLGLLYGNSREESRRQEFYLFPFLFYEKDPEEGTSAALFPIGGTLRNWFRRDKITFALFPLYSRTEKGDRRIDNILWPFFARIRGEQESGFKFWPLYGSSRKEGVYRKRFFLWPVFFAEDLALDSNAPVRKRAAWPFYLSIETGKSRYTSVLWPFFSRQQGIEEPFDQWDIPWPLIRLTRGEQRHGFRFLPLYADETVKNNRTVWYLWPVYKREEIETEQMHRRRHRILYFLYSDLLEQHFETGEQKKRIDFWPLFSYSKEAGLNHLHLFSLLEPFFPGNRGIEENWAPLWRIYQQKWDSQGNRIISLFWNLYWQDQRADGSLAWELFPFFEFRRSADDVDMRLLKGMLTYHAGSSGEGFLKFLYLPWELSLANKTPAAMEPGSQ